MTKENKAKEVMDQATDNAAETVKGINFQDTNTILDQFNSEIDKASELASAKVKYGK